MFVKGDRVWVTVSRSHEPVVRRLKGTFHSCWPGDGAYYVLLDGNTRPNRWNKRLVTAYTVLDAMVDE
jgi:hypothetical protein